MGINKSVYLYLMIDSMWLDVFHYNLNLSWHCPSLSEGKRGRVEPASQLRNVLKHLCLETDTMNEKIF